ncbi:hypothetical protein BGX28_009112 [Mortierella sp. GBA30]|nr:hypothetical protein BGX28_009112 [Mortierella sp. GBA30]
MSAPSTIAIAGATGTLGTPITNALLDFGYKVKVLTRSVTTNDKLAAFERRGATVVYDAFSGNNLVAALKGVEVLVSAVAGDFYNSQVPLIDAAKAAGVKRFVPSEFGIDTIKYNNDTHPFLVGKNKLRDYLEKSGLEYTYIFNAIFAEYLPALGFNVTNKTATIHTAPSTRLSVTLLADIGRFTAQALASPLSRNAALRVASYTAPIQDLVHHFEQATGGKWHIVQDLDARERIAKSNDPAQGFADFVAYVHSRSAFDTTDSNAVGFKPTPINDIITKIVKVVH